MVVHRICWQLLLIAAVSTITACAPGPDVRVLEHTVASQGPDGLELDVDLEITNPGEEPVELLELRYAVGADGDTWYRGRHAALVTVDRKGRRVLTVPAVVPDDAGAAAGGPYTISGELSYVLPGAFNRTLMDIGLRRPPSFVPRNGLDPLIARRVRHDPNNPNDPRIQSGEPLVVGGHR